MDVLALGLVGVGMLFGPGAVVLGLLERVRSRWVRGLSGEEKLLGVMGMSLLLCYVAGLWVAWARCYGAQLWIGWGSVGCAVIGFRALLAMYRCRTPVREGLKAASLVVVGLGAMMAVPHYFGGGKWAGDWLEHLERAAYFRGRLGEQFRFLDLYVLSARPPLQNVLVALLLSVTRGRVDDVRVDQWACVLFTVPTVLTLMAWTRTFGLGAGRRGTAGMWLLAALLLGSPMFCAHLLFLWTRILTAFFVLSGLYFYIRAIGKRDLRRGVLAMMLLSAGMLTHYSAGPFLAGIVVHLLAVGGRRMTAGVRAVGVRAAGGRVVGGPVVRSRAVGGVLLCLAASVVVLSTWWVPAVGRFGLAEVFTSTSAVSDTGQLSLRQNTMKVAYNLFTSFVPHPLHLSGETFRSYFAQRSALGWWRDYVFHIDVTTLPGMMGPLLGVPVLLAVVRRLRSSAGVARRFWVFLTLWVIVVGIGVHGEADDFGAAHICLLPLALLGLATLAAELPWMARGWRQAALIALALSWVVSICPNLYCLSEFGGPGESILRRDWPLSWHAYEQAGQLRRLGQSSVGTWLGEWWGGWRGAACLMWVGTCVTAYVRAWRQVNGERPR